MPGAFSFSSHCPVTGHCHRSANHTPARPKVLVQNNAMTRLERAYLGKLEEGDVDFFDGSIPLLLTAGRSCHDTMNERPTPGLFALEPSAFTNGFVCVKLTQSLTAWGCVICTPEYITTIVHVNDWMDLYNDLEQFATGSRAKSTLLYAAFGSDDDAYDLFKRTLSKATKDSHSHEFDPHTSVPPASSHIVIDSIATCACVLSEPPPSMQSVGRDEFLWFHDVLVAQGFAEFPNVSGVTRYYTGKATPRARMVLQMRDVRSDPQKLSHVRTDDSLASIEAIRRVLSAGGSTLPGMASNLPIIQEDLVDLIPSVSSETAFPTPSCIFTCEEGVHSCIAGLLLVDWEARLFSCSEPPNTVYELIACFHPEPTIIVKQRSWLLFHRDLSQPMPLNASQAGYVLNRYSSVVLYDAQAKTGSRLRDNVKFRLSHGVANDALSKLIADRQKCDTDTRPTKRLRRLLRVK